MKKIISIFLAAITVISCFFVMTSVSFAATNGWVKSDSNWSYYESGKKATGWRKIDKKWYHFNGSGIMQTGWVKSGTSHDGNSAWYYLGSDGAMKTGWQKIEGYWYYLSTYAGTRKDGYNCYSVKEGEMITGWLMYNGKWYYLCKKKTENFPRGSMITNAKITFSDGVYRFNDTGVGTRIS